MVIDTDESAGKGLVALKTNQRPSCAFLTDWLTKASIACKNLDRFQYRTRVNALVERREDERFQRLRDVLRVHRHQLGRRRAESPRDRFRKNPSRDGFRPSGNGNFVGRCLGQAVDQIRVVFKSEGLRPQPAPGTG